jgi:hypothetical protein
MNRLVRAVSVLLALVATLGFVNSASTLNEPDLREQAREAMQRAAVYYHSQVATHGGYVYFYSLDLQTRWGEGQATPTQIWVQLPGTPTVGMSYVDAFEATGE